MAIINGFNEDELELAPGEALVSVMRKHWFILFISVFPYLILLALPPVIMAFVPSSSVSDIGLVLIIYFSALWMLIILMIVFTVWTTYYLDLWIVTNYRIIDIEQK